MSRYVSPRPLVAACGVVAWLLAASEPGYAQPGPLAADRPDFTEATETVGRGVFQIEFGWALATTVLEGERGLDIELSTQSLGEPLIRVGVLADWLELRIGLNPVSQSATAAGLSRTETGLEDLYLGVKLALARQDGVRPAITIIPGLTVPTGSDAFSSDRTLPGVNFVYAWDVPGDLSLAGGTQVNRAVSESGDGYAAWAQSLTTGLAIDANIALYAEWFAFYLARPEGTRIEHYFNWGFTFGLTEDVQADIRAGVGLNEAAVDRFVGTGLAVRIP